MNTHFNNVQKQIEDNIEFVKTSRDEWKINIKKNNIKNDDKDNYMRYGSIMVLKYCYKQIMVIGIVISQ